MKFIVLALLAISSTVSAQVAPANDQIKLVPAIKKIAIVDNKHYAIKKDENNKYVFIKVTPEGHNIIKPQIITVIPAK